MSLTFSTLSATQVDRALTALTLDEATSIQTLKDLVDKIIDWFQGSIQGKAITELFSAISNIRNTDGINSELSRLEHFMELREKVLPQHRDQFTLEIKNKDVNGNWGFSLTVADVEIYSSEDVSHFSDCAKLPNFYAKKISMELENMFFSQKEILENPRNFIDCNIQCMVDGKEKEDALLLILDDPAYSKANFIGTREGSSNAIFIASFKDGKELEFSNRNPTNSELRGPLLKSALENFEYSNLKELVSVGHLTERDTMLKYAVSAISNKYYVPLLEKEDNLLSDTELKKLQAEFTSIQVGKTTLDKILGIKTD